LIQDTSYLYTQRLPLKRYKLSLYTKITIEDVFG
jgi:hypothetical protein